MNYWKHKWLLLLILVLNNTLFSSIAAAMHASVDHHYESAHVHFDEYEHEHDHHHDHSDDSQDTADDHDAFEHEKSAHAHFPCEHCQLPSLLDHINSDADDQFRLFYLSVYIGLTYAPPVPPPNA